MKENYFNDFQRLKVVFDEKEGDEDEIVELDLEKIGALLSSFIQRISVFAK